MEYRYTYDNKGRVATFEEGEINSSDVFEPTDKYSYQYTDFGYKYIVEREDVKNSYKYQYIYMYNTFEPEHMNFLHSAKTRRHNGTEYKDYSETVYSYDDGLLTETKIEHDNESDIQYDSRTEYYYNTDSSKSMIKEFKKHEDSHGDYEEYLYRKTTYASGKGTDNLYYDTKTTYYYANFDGETIGSTATRTEKWLDEARLYKTLYDNRNVNSSNVVTVFDTETFSYNDDLQLTEYTHSHKINNETKTTSFGKTYTYTNKKIASVATTKNEDTTPKVNKVTNYNDKGLAVEIVDNLKHMKTVNTYDTNNKKTQAKIYAYINATIGYRLASELFYGADNELIPNKQIAYEYDTNNKVNKITESIYDNAMAAMVGVATKEIVKSYTNEIITKKETNERYGIEAMYAPKSTLVETYSTDGTKVLTSLEKNYSENGKLKVESYNECYASGSLKETYDKIYEADGVTVKSGSKITYTEAGAEEAEYTWDTTTNDWKEV